MATLKTDNATLRVNIRKIVKETNDKEQRGTKRVNVRLENCQCKRLRRLFWLHLPWYHVSMSALSFTETSAECGACDYQYG